MGPSCGSTMAGARRVVSPPDPKGPKGRRSTLGGVTAEGQNAKVHELVAMAHALCDEGRAREAEDMARWALTQAPQFPGAHVVLGRARFEQGQLREARVILEAVVLRNPAYFIAHRWLAEVLVKLGDLPAASDILVRAEALSPRDTRIAELVRQVMGGAPPGRAPDPKGVPVPPVDPALLPAQAAKAGAKARYQTYETSALPPETPKPSSGPNPTRTTAMMASGAGQPASMPPAVPASSPSSSRLPAAPRPQPTRQSPSQSGSQSGPTGGARTRTTGSYAAAAAPPWRRVDRSLVLLALGGIAIFGLTVFAVSWALRQPRGDFFRPPEPVISTVAEPVVTGAFTERFEIRAKDRRRQVPGGTEPTARSLLAEAMLASEYGLPLDPDSEIWADELSEKAGTGPGSDELLAARILDRLSRGDRKAAAELSLTRGLGTAEAPVLRYAEARRLAREGDIRNALIRTDTAQNGFLPLRLMRAELLLDQANASPAHTLVTSVLTESPGHPGAVRLLLEARAALGGAVPPNERQAITQACGTDARRIPALDAACRLHGAITLRREGKRRAALRGGLDAMEVVPAEPRLLASIAQLMNNLGAVEDAQELIARAERLADRRYPPLAWAIAGQGIARDRMTMLPDGPAPGPEARLIAARSIFVGPPPRRKSLDRLGVTEALAQADSDLRWVADGAGARGKRAAAVLTRKAQSQYGSKLPGPVASYVVGTLARLTGQQRLAETSLSRSLAGHGDACRAATLYLLSLRDRGRNPLLNARLQRAIGRLECDEAPGALPAAD
ncbi:MAG TPA: tetratricopeptide repeat protein, partial [Polyangia bacterium]